MEKLKELFNDGVEFVKEHPKEVAIGVLVLLVVVMIAI